MQRTVITPADLSGPALADLKDWLGISRPNEDDLLTSLMEASLTLCEAFTGQAPIEQVIEESIPATAAANTLVTRPIQGLVSVERVAGDGTRSAVLPEAYEFDVNSEGVGCLRLTNTLDTQRLVVTLRAGIAANWSALPRPLKHGMIRLAAFNYRDRESGRSPNPPSSVSALWRPWRVLRLS